VRTATVDQRSGTFALWDLVITHVEGRRSSLPGGAVDLVIADMRERAVAAGPLTSGNGRDHLIEAYQAALDFVMHMAAELFALGATLDDPIDIRDPNSSLLVRVQSMLWDHIRTSMQLRLLIEEQAS
jgi:hypothetical protein